MVSAPICGYINGSPPQMETTGAPHSSTAARHSSSGTRSAIVSSYSRMRPQPVQVRLQACSGSSISTIGKRLPIIGCGWCFSPAFGGRMRNGLAALASPASFFCHSGRGRILFLKMYPARPAVIESGNFIACLSRWLGSSRTKTARVAGNSLCIGGSSNRIPWGNRCPWPVPLPSFHPRAGSLKDTRCRGAR